MSLGGGGDTKFAFSMLMFSVAVTLLLSMLIPIYAPKVIVSDAENQTLAELENQYKDFTGSLPASEMVWGLRGIYTPYGQDDNGYYSTAWGYTEDGWLYGMRVVNHAPSQYSGSNAGAYAAYYDSTTGLYKYTNTSTTVNKHNAGDLYGSVVMDVSKKSDIFFSTSTKTEMDGKFYYQFTGYRYAFAPISEYKALDSNGNAVDVVPNTTTLSLIWYQYYNQSGISGQLVISGSDKGVAYLTASEIVSAFNPDVYASRFTMTFNGVEMILSIRLDPYYISNNVSIEDCYNNGFWSIMVSSKSVDANAYNAADYKPNPEEMFTTMMDLLTFHTEDYGLSGMAGTLASIIIVVPLFVALIAIGLDNYIVVIMAGIYAAIVAISKMDLSSLFG